MTAAIYTILIILAIAAFAILVWYVSTRNSIKRADLSVAEAESGIDVALTKRHDMLTKALDAAKACAANERLTLMSVTELRKGASIAEKAAMSARMDEAFGKINALAEAYPELRSGDAFAALQAQTADAEEHLQAARRLYNGNVTRFNEKLETFPSNLVASRMCLVKKELFTADAEKKQDVSISL